MESLIPLPLYYTIFGNVLLLLILLMSVNTNSFAIDHRQNITLPRAIGYIYVPFLLVYIGLRPISYLFVDMPMYAHTFETYVDGSTTLADAENDIGFYFFTSMCAKLVSIETYFFLCAVLYIVPLLVASIKMFNKYWFFGFIMMVASFSFLGYGVNGIRNGIATSIFVLALAYRRKTVAMVALLLLSVSFHKTMYLPLLALITAMLYKNLKLYIKIWLFSIPLSFILGSLFITLFTALGFDDARVDIYMSDVVQDEASLGGFRFDFILYSATGVFAAWYYIIKQKFSDPLYELIASIYIIANTFWIMVIRAEFSNRFAYLSWFLLAVVIFYPLLKVHLIPRQNKVLAAVMLLYFLFTYVLIFLP